MLNITVLEISNDTLWQRGEQEISLSPGLRLASTVTALLQDTRSTGGTSAGSESAITTIGNVTTYRDSTGNPSTTYYYKVTALNNFGESPDSSEPNANAGSPQATGNILGLPPVAFYGIIGALIAAVAVFTMLFLRRRSPVK